MKTVLKLCFLLILYIPNFAVGGVHACRKNSNYDDVLLVVHYNHPYYGSIEFIKTLYSDFPNIVFYGDKPNEVDPNKIIQVPTTTGFLFTRVVADVLTRFPYYRGYIFLQDDVLMNFWNFPRLNKDKIWFGIDIHRGHGTVPASWGPDFPRQTIRLPRFIPGSYWWNTPYGNAPLEKALTQLNKNEKELLIKNLGCYGKTKVVCDMFYVPGKFKKKVLRLSKIFEDVFCEIAVPMMLSCLDSTENWEHLRAQWGVDLSSSDYPGLVYREEADWVHPLKFSKQTCRDFALNAVQAHARKGIE